MKLLDDPREVLDYCLKVENEVDETRLMVNVKDAMKQTLSTNIRGKNYESLGLALYDGKQGDYGWSAPPDYHVTTLFVGGKQQMHREKQFAEFQEGKECEVEMCGILLVDEKLITAIVRTGEPVENKHPHITILLRGNTKAKDSNYYLEWFAEEKQREYDYFVRGRGDTQFNCF